MTDTEQIASLASDQVLAITLYGEARSEPVEGRIAIASVIRNRVNTDIGNDSKPDWWGEGYRGVCLAPWQFSCWTPKGGPGQQQNYDVVMAVVRAALNGVSPGPVMRECLWLALGIISGDLRDRVNGATHYLTADLFRINPPLWAKGKTPPVRIGSHLFFKDVG